MKRADLHVGEAYEASYGSVVVVVAHGFSAPDNYGHRGNRKGGRGVLVLVRSHRVVDASIEAAEEWAKRRSADFDALPEGAKLNPGLTVPEGWRLDIMMGLSAFKRTWAESLIIQKAEQEKRDEQQRALEAARLQREQDLATLLDGLSALGIDDHHLEVEHRRGFPGERAVIIDVATFVRVLDKAIRGDLT